MNKYIKIIIAILTLGFLFQAHSFAQKTVVVKDESGNPVAGATVIIGEDGKPITTNEKGEFSITTKGRVAILIEAENFDSQLLNYEPSAIPNEIVLPKPLTQMSEKDKVNIPFGVVYKRQTTGGISTIKPDDILLYDYSGSLNELLNGRIPGLYGSSNIRGIYNTIYTTAGNFTFGTPLYVIDGVARPSAGNMNVQDIDQISVLRDLSTAMLYGPQATNGVIYITTKRGAPLKKGLMFTFEKGFDKPISYPNYLSAGEYMKLYNEALDNDGLSPKYTTDQIDSTINKSNLIRFPDEDYYNSTYLKNWSGYHRLNAEVSGGNDIAQFFLNLGWSRSTGLIKIGEGENEKRDRLSMRGNIDYKITDGVKLTFDGSVMFNISKLPRYTSASNNFWVLASQLRPDIYPVLIPLNLLKPQSLQLAAKPVNGNYVFGGTSEFQTNIYGELTKNGNRGYLDRLMGIRTGLDFDLKTITQGLKASVFFSFDMYNQYQEEIQNSYAVYNPVYVNDTIDKYNIYKTDLKVDTKTVADAYYYRGIGTYGTLDYHRIFGDHEINATGLVYMDLYSIEAILQDIKHLHGGLRVNYMFKNKYVAQLTGVESGSAKLYDSKRWSFSPGIGLGWIISEEDFLKGNSMVNYLKVRGNWAVLNTDENMGASLRAMGDFMTAGALSSSEISAFMSSFNLGRDYFTSGSSFAWSQGTYTNTARNIIYGNPNLTWEKIMNYSLGLEAMLLNNSIGVEASYFYNKYYDQVVRRTNTLPNFFGNLPFENYGSSETKGMELGINYTTNIGDLKIRAGANILYAVPKVLVIDELAYEDDYRRQTGKASDAVFGLIADGLFKDQADIDNSVLQEFGTVQPGDIKYKDMNQDGRINDDDITIIGNSRARTEYGLNVFLQYKNFELFALGRGQSGQERFFSNAYYWVYGDRKYSESVLDRWTPATAASATYPRLSSSSNANNFRNSTFWLYETNWFNIETMQLNFRLPGREFAGVNEFRFFLRGTNLAMFAKEKEKLQLNIGSLPQMRSFSLGFNVIF